MATNINDAKLAGARRIADAARGSAKACYDLGVFYSTGTGGVAFDLIEAHKWFNVAAVNGHEEAQHCRSEIAGDMTAREIATAQAAARAWIMQGRRAA